jgi:hypothetical protein
VINAILPFNRSIVFLPEWTRPVDCVMDNAVRPTYCRLKL